MDIFKFGKYNFLYMYFELLRKHLNNTDTHFLFEKPPFTNTRNLTTDSMTLSNLLKFWQVFNIFKPNLSSVYFLNSYFYKNEISCTKHLAIH